MFRRSNSGFFFLRRETKSKKNEIKKNHEHGNCYNFGSVKFRVTHMRSIGSPIIALLKGTSWLRHCQNSYEGKQYKLPPHTLSHLCWHYVTVVKVKWTWLTLDASTLIWHHANPQAKKIHFFHRPTNNYEGQTLHI